ILAVNVGGAFSPTILSIYLLSKNGLWGRGLVATFCIAVMALGRASVNFGAANQRSPKPCRLFHPKRPLISRAPHSKRRRPNQAPHRAASPRLVQLIQRTLHRSPLDRRPRESAPPERRSRVKTKRASALPSR